MADQQKEALPRRQRARKATPQGGPDVLGQRAARIFWALLLFCMPFALGGLVVYGVFAVSAGQAAEPAMKSDVVELRVDLAAQQRQMEEALKPTKKVLGQNDTPDEKVRKWKEETDKKLSDLTTQVAELRKLPSSPGTKVETQPPGLAKDVQDLKAAMKKINEKIDGKSDKAELATQNEATKAEIKKAKATADALDVTVAGIKTTLKKIETDLPNELKKAIEGQFQANLAKAISADLLAKLKMAIATDLPALKQAIETDLPANLKKAIAKELRDRNAAIGVLEQKLTKRINEELDVERKATKDAGEKLKKNEELRKATADKLEKAKADLGKIEPTDVLVVASSSRYWNANLYKNELRGLIDPKKTNLPLNTQVGLLIAEGGGLAVKVPLRATAKTVNDEFLRFGNPLDITTDQLSDLLEKIDKEMPVPKEKPASPRHRRCVLVASMAAPVVAASQLKRWKDLQTHVILIGNNSKDGKAEPERLRDWYAFCRNCGGSLTLLSAAGNGERHDADVARQLSACLRLATLPEFKR